MDSSRNREVICIQSGQAGVQLGHAMWELLTVEHGLDSTGLLHDHLSILTEPPFLTFFSQTAEFQSFPRALIFDTEPTVIDEIRCGYYRKLFNPEFLINGNEDAANNFSRGYYTESKRMIHTLVDKVRHMVEHCEHFQGFIVQSSTAGGTGSGLLTSLMEYLVIEFAGRINIQLSIYPGTKLSNCIVQPYNCVLTQEKLVYCANINIIVDNEELYAICSNQLDMKRPSYSNINRLICPILSGLTAPIRFKGLLNSDLSDITTNLIPFPRLHFPFVSYSPLMSDDKSDHDLINTESLTRSMFLKENQFVNADLQNGYFMSSAILYRGNCDLSNILKTIQDIKTDKNLHWVDWCPTAFKISHTVQMSVSIPKHGPTDYDKSAMMLSNHNAIIPTLKSLEIPYRILLKREAYLHWYLTEGMEKSEFEHALYEVQTISDDYNNVVDHMFIDNPYSSSFESVKSFKATENLKQISEKSEENYEESYKHEIIHQQSISTNASNNNIQKIVKNIINKKGQIKKNSKMTSISSNIFQTNSSAFKENYFNVPKFKILSNINYENAKLKSIEILNDKLDMKYLFKKTNKNNSLCDNITFTPLENNYHSNEAYLNNFISSNDVIYDLNNASTEIFEICERNYINDNFKNFNKRPILRQYDELADKKHNPFIKKIYLKKKGIFQKIRGIQEYNFFQSSVS